MVCPIKLSFKYSSSFFYIFFEIIFLLMDYFLDKANSILIKKKCWHQNDDEKETFNEKIFFSLCHKIFLVFSIFLYFIHLCLSKSKKKNKNIFNNDSYILKANASIIDNIFNYKIININKRYKLYFFLTTLLFLSIFFDCFQYFKKINLLYESIPFAFLSIIILNKFLVKDYYGKQQKYAIYLCIIVTIIFQIYFYYNKIIESNDYEHFSYLYIFNAFYFMFIGFKLSLLTYLNKIYFINAYEMFAFEGVGYFLIILFNFIICSLNRLNVIKHKGGSKYKVNNIEYNHFLFYLCRNIIGFFITYFFYLIICFNNLNNYIISDIISKFIYFTTYKAYLRLKKGKKNDDDNNYYITLILNSIVFISSFIFNEIIIIKNISFFKETQEYLKKEEKKEIIELNCIMNNNLNNNINNLNND